MKEYCKNKEICALRGVCSACLLSALKTAPTFPVRDCSQKVKTLYSALLLKSNPKYIEEHNGSSLLPKVIRLNPLFNCN